MGHPRSRTQSSSGALSQQQDRCLAGADQFACGISKDKGLQARAGEAAQGDQARLIGYNALGYDPHRVAVGNVNGGARRLAAACRSPRWGRLLRREISGSCLRARRSAISSSILSAAPAGDQDQIGKGSFLCLFGWPRDVQFCVQQSIGLLSSCINPKAPQMSVRRLEFINRIETPLNERHTFQLLRRQSEMA